ncbi:unnamed protein product [Lampetra planeri]
MVPSRRRGRQEVREGSDVPAGQGGEVWDWLSDHTPTAVLPPSRRGAKRHTWEQHIREQDNNLIKQVKGKNLKERVKTVEGFLQKLFANGERF